MRSAPRPQYLPPKLRTNSKAKRIQTVFEFTDGALRHFKISLDSKRQGFLYNFQRFLGLEIP